MTVIYVNKLAYAVDLNSSFVVSFSECVKIGVYIAW